MRILWNWFRLLTNVANATVLIWAGNELHVGPAMWVLIYFLIMAVSLISGIVRVESKG